MSTIAQKHFSVGDFFQYPPVQKAIALAALVVAWELIVTLGNVSAFVFPSFSSVMAALFHTVADGSILATTWVTLRLVLISFMLSTSLALIVTALAITTVWGRVLLETVTEIFQPLPAIALLPMAILWFGLNDRALIFVVIMSMIWPIAAALSTGLGTTPLTLVRVGTNYQLNKLQLFSKIMLPNALPSIISGLRVGWGYGWRSIVAAELVFGSTGEGVGLGFYIENSRQYLRTAESFSGIIVVIIIGLIAEALFRLLQRRTTYRWGLERGASIR